MASSGEPAPRDLEVAEQVRRACIEAAIGGYERAAMSGLCGEGAWEAAISAVRMLDVAALLRPEGGART